MKYEVNAKVRGTRYEVRSTNVKNEVRREKYKYEVRYLKCEGLRSYDYQIKIISPYFLRYPSYFPLRTCSTLRTSPFVSHTLTYLLSFIFLIFVRIVFIEATIIFTISVPSLIVQLFFRIPN